MQAASGLHYASTEFYAHTANYAARLWGAASSVEASTGRGEGSGKGGRCGVESLPEYFHEAVWPFAVGGGSEVEQREHDQTPLGNVTRPLDEFYMFLRTLTITKGGGGQGKRSQACLMLSV